MKHICMLIAACSLYVGAWGGEIRLETVRKKPNFLVVVHASRDFRMYFETSDLKKAFRLLPAEVQKRYDISFLQDSQLYRIDLSTDRRMQYQTALQPLIQHELGAFLLLHGKAWIETGDGRRRIRSIRPDRAYELVRQRDDGHTPIQFSDAKTGIILFDGRIRNRMIFEYWPLK